MKLSFIFKLIQTATTFSNWYKKASEDGKIDLDEVAALLKAFAEIFGINIAVKLPEIQK